MTALDNEEFEFLLETLLNTSLPYLEADKFEADHEYRWSMLYFLVGSASALSDLSVEKAAITTCVGKVLSRTLGWPLEGAIKYAEQAFDERLTDRASHFFHIGADTMKQFRECSEKLSVLLS